MSLYKLVCDIQDSPVLKDCYSFESHIFSALQTMGSIEDQFNDSGLESISVSDSGDVELLFMVWSESKSKMRVYSHLSVSVDAQDLEDELSQLKIAVKELEEAGYYGKGGNL